MGVDNIVAIILGVLFTIRKLDAQKRTNQEFSHVAPRDFADWQRREVSTFGAAMIASFAKVFFDWGFIYFLADQMTARSVQLIGATIFFLWIFVMVFTFMRTRKLAQLRILHRIVLGGFVVESGSQLSEELKSALRKMEEGNLERANYEIKQVILDADDSLKGIALYWLGECYLRENRIDEAKDSFCESLENDPTLSQPQEALNRLNKNA